MPDETPHSSAPQSKPVNTTPLSWQDETPYSPHFDDIYFSKKNGAAESDYVFIKHNRLEERWAALQAHEQFIIAETGFGTGLNFLVAWNAWQQREHRQGHLHFVSVEQYPLSKKQLMDIYQRLSIVELEPLAQQLIDQYHLPTRGILRAHFQTVTLTLLIGDASQRLSETRLNVDAWFLDGFAPKKNPSMWTEVLFQLMARSSHSSSTFSTFTSAGPVRRGLAAAGFIVNKTVGYGSKREMCYGSLSEGFISNNFTSNSFTSNNSRDLHDQASKTYPIEHTPWFKFAEPPPKNIRKISIIGAGLAGCHSAYSLARRGYEVHLIERSPAIASQASGNPRGILYTKCCHSRSAQNRFYQDSYGYALRFMQRHKDALDQETWNPTGVIQTIADDDHQEKGKINQQQRLHALFDNGEYRDGSARLATAAELSEHAGIHITQPGVLFPFAGDVSPRALCQYLLDTHKDRIHISLNQNALSLKHHAEDTYRWQIRDQDDVISQADAVIIANSHDAQLMDNCAFIQLQSIRGQISYLQSPDELKPLRCSVHQRGYITPAYQGLHCVGASFHPHDTDTQCRTTDHQANLDELLDALPTLAPLQDQWRTQRLSEHLSGRVAFRCQSPDYIPLIGAVADANAMAHTYAGLGTGKLKQRYPRGDYQSALFMNVAHGSRGISSAPIAAELLADLISGTPSPLTEDIEDAVNPTRFLIRRLKRRSR